MSYSIRARGANLTLALAALATTFDAEVIVHQPEHKADRELMLGTAEGVGNLAKFPDDHDVEVVASGGLGWNGRNDDGSVNITQANVAVHVYPVARAPA